MKKIIVLLGIISISIAANQADDQALLFMNDIEVRMESKSGKVPNNTAKNSVEYPYVVSITNKYKDSILYDPALIAGSLRYDPQLTLRYRAAMIMKSYFLVASGSWVGLGVPVSIFFTKNLIQGMNIFNFAFHARQVASAQQHAQAVGGDYPPVAPFVPQTFGVKAHIIPVTFGLGSLIFLHAAYNAAKNATLSTIEKPTIIKPGQKIRFVMWLKDENADPIVLIYSAIKLIASSAPLAAESK